MGNVPKCPRFFPYKARALATTSGAFSFFIHDVTIHLQDHLFIVPQKLGNLFSGDCRNLIAQFRTVIMAEYMCRQTEDHTDIFVSTSGSIHFVHDTLPHPGISSMCHDPGILVMEKIFPGDRRGYNFLIAPPDKAA